MEAKTDAQRIGVELQNLLKIPPITKVNSGRASSSSDHFGILQIEKMILTQDNNKAPKSNVLIGRAGATEPERPRETVPPTVQILKSPERSASHSKASGDSPRVSVVDSLRKAILPHNNAKSNNSSEDTTLAYTLKRPECPRDLQLEADALLEYANKERNGVQMSPSLKNLLSEHYVDLLSKKSSKFPKAKYFCGHCNYHMDTISACVSHIMGIRHTSFEQMRKLEYTLVHIPNPSQEHSSSLGLFLTSVMNQYGLSDVEMERRRQYINGLNRELELANIGCSLSLYGSSRTGLGFKDSDINVNVIVSDDSELFPNSPPKSSNTIAAENSDMLQKLFLFFQRHQGSSEVKKLVSSKSAKIQFRESGNLCEVVLSMNNNAGVETAKLFTEYSKLSPLVRLLTLGFRVWAKYCEIDNQDKGCLPPHSYAIMVIHYLQQKDLLPNLHIMNENCNKMDAAEKDRRSFATAEDASSYWKSCTPMNLGYHWLKMLCFYAIEFNYKESVISISHHNVMRAEKYWNRKISIEDPVIPKSNLSRCMSNNRMCDYILERLKFTYLYFGIPRTIRGPLYDGIVCPENACLCVPQVFHRVIRVPTLTSNPPRQPAENVTNRKWDPFSLTDEVRAVKWGGKVEFPAFELSVIKLRVHEYADNDHKNRTDILVDDVVAADNIFPEWLYDYRFDTEILQNGLKPPIVCKSCGAEGHFRSDCPDEILPVLRPVMNATPSALRLLNDVLIRNHDKEALNSYDVDVRTKIVEELEAALLPIYPDAILTMFGSTHNGFGVHMSDVDVCLTFRNKSSLKMEELVGDEETSAIVILRTIVERLKSTGFLQEVLAIPSAKVPIVKFRHRSSCLEGDISLYNTLAMYNTRLLRTYAEMDPRVKIIGCFLKKLTKLCDISDASRGSLSSYGYVLMAVHYFQHTPIPVLPVLQELCRDTLPPIIVDGCDVQYFKDIPNLKFVWRYYGQNRQSLAELWLGFLNYYTETFNFEEHVVTISQLNTLTRVYKFWLTDALAIEDPFDRTHNLGAGLSRRMSIHILKSFHHLRQVFHAAYDASMLRKHKDWLSFFTDPKLLQNGNPPLDRQCRICHKIGHIARNCTQNDKSEEIPVAKKEDKPTPTLMEVIEQVQGNRRPSNATKSVEENFNGQGFFESVRPGGGPNIVLRPHVVRNHSPVCVPQQDPAFPKFFGDTKQPNPDDEVLYRMINSNDESKTPGVEFLFPGDLSQTDGNLDQIKLAHTLESLILNAGEAYYNSAHSNIPYHNNLPGNFNDSNVKRMRVVDAPVHHNHGVTFMGPPAFQPVSIQYMGNPNLGIQTVTPPPPGFAPLPTLPIVSHPTYIHPHAIPNHPFPLNIYPIPVMSSAHHHEVRHPAQAHMHPFPMFTSAMGPLIRTQSDSASSIPNGETTMLGQHGSPPLVNGFQSDSNRVCLSTVTSLSPIMTSYTYPDVQQYPRVNDK